MRRKSLIWTLLVSLALPSALAVLTGTFIVYSVVREEYGELQDVDLASKAQLLMRLYEATAASGPALAPDALEIEKSLRENGEMTVFQVIDDLGHAVVQSPGADAAALPADLDEGFHTAQDHRIYVLRAGGNASASIVVGVPMTELDETVRDVVLGVLFGFLLLCAIFVAISYWSVRRSVGIVRNLARNISAKGEHDLSPIDRANSFAEIEPAIDTLDKLMARLETALSAERAFATNAAHELRTPIAVSIAQVQRLRASVPDLAASPKIGEIEAALKRLLRLTERLLQLSRTQSGLGSQARVYDVREVLNLLLDDLRRKEPSADRLVILHPERECHVRVDPDALGIMLNNLFDNASKHSSGSLPIVLDARESCRIEISNDCDPIAPGDLEAITGRFIRKAPLTDGFGLGLSIVQQLCEQSGCTLKVRSPQKGKLRGFTAVLRIPEQKATP